MPKQLIFPFVAIAGQTDMKTALLLNVIDPGIGGVLIKGEKGTAKSTAVRSLAQILPETECIKGCAYRCDPGLGRGYVRTVPKHRRKERCWNMKGHRCVSSNCH